MSWLDTSMVLAFLAAMFWIGIRVSRYIKEADDFYVAGRELTPFLLAATITATNVNMYSFVGQAGEAARSGLGIIWNCWLGNMGLVAAGLFVVPILRRLRIRTVPEFLEMRYSRGVRVFVGVLWALRLTFWLAVILTAATTAARTITGIENPWPWLVAFAAIAMVYSAVGGAWAVAVTDAIQFVIMLAGALIVLPIAMHLVGWMPNLIKTLEETGRSEHLRFVTQGQEFNWLFIIAMLLLSVKWACIDQGILQRAFGGRDPRTVAKGMVLSGILTTPFAFLWILPGLANAVLQPAVERSDSVIPMFLATYIPMGVLGLVLCGLLASQLSTISADINSVATLLTNDLYNALSPGSSQKHLLRVVRGSTIFSGVLMILLAHFVVSAFRSVVDAQLTIVGILDMPIFIIAIVYGLGSRRANWQGAIGGFVIGASAGLTCYLYFKKNPDLSSLGWVVSIFGEAPRWDRWAKSLAAIASTLAALVATPLVSAVFPAQKETPATRQIREALKDPAVAPGEISIVPTSLRGKVGLGLVIAGFLLFLPGVISGGAGWHGADALAITGMVTFFVGGGIRVYSE